MHKRWIEGSAHRREEAKDKTIFLEWGLASNGELCCRGSFGYCNYPDWTPYECTAFAVSLLEMKKIVKEFGHLVVFA